MYSSAVKPDNLALPFPGFSSTLIVEVFCSQVRVKSVVTTDFDNGLLVSLNIKGCQSFFGLTPLLIFHILCYNDLDRVIATFDSGVVR